MKKEDAAKIDRWASLLKRGGVVPILVIGMEPGADDSDYRLMTPDTMTPAEARAIIRHIADTPLKQYDPKPGEDPKP